MARKLLSCSNQGSGKSVWSEATSEKVYEMATREDPLFMCIFAWAKFCVVIGMGASLLKKAELVDDSRLNKT